MVFAIFSGDGGATFIEHAREQSASAEANTWTARGTLREIGRIHDLNFTRERFVAC
jgi:hypothetical protein